MQSPVEDIVRLLAKAHWLITGGAGPGCSGDRAARYAAIHLQDAMMRLGHDPGKSEPRERPDPTHGDFASDYARASVVRGEVAIRAAEVDPR